MESEPQASSGGQQPWWLLCDFSFGWVLQVPSCAWPRSIPLEQICPCMQALGMWARATPGVWFLRPCILPLKLMLPFAARSLAGCSSPGWGWEQVLGDLELGSWVRWAVPPGPAYQSNTNWEFSGKNQIALKMLKLMKSYWGICFYVNIHNFSRVTNCSAPKYISFTYINIYIYMSHVYMYTSMYQTLGLLKSFTPTVGHWEDSLL